MITASLGSAVWPVLAPSPGAALIAAGGALVLHAFVRFVTEGRGTPAPAAPPQRLVVGGLYRFVRNPMYVAVVSIVTGQAMLLARTVLYTYSTIAWLVMAGFVRFHEEPSLRQRFGADCDRYCTHARAWIPRVAPWRGDETTPA